MKNTINRVEVLKRMARDTEAGAGNNNYKVQIYRSIAYLIATDYNDNLDINIFHPAFADDFRCARKNSELFNLVYLLMDPSESPKNLIDILYYACYGGYYETVKYLIKQGVDINYTSENQQSLGSSFYSPEYLFTEVYDKGHIDIAYLLLEAGIKINHYDFVKRKSKFGYEKCEIIGYLIQKMYNLKWRSP